ncbi:hypothetical protein BDZ45DRAFT_154840 [Acephala macrosclerotiorum]|nr:hypothetical protein BDZ45DRAFT_154840 [Acephala macrosclerotiorum]
MALSYRASVKGTHFRGYQSSLGSRGGSQYNSTISDSSSTAQLHAFAPPSFPFESQVENWAHESQRHEMIGLGLASQDEGSNSAMLNWDAGFFSSFGRRDDSEDEFGSVSSRQTYQGENRNSDASNSSIATTRRPLFSPEPEDQFGFTQQEEILATDDAYKDAESSHDTAQTHPWTSVREDTTIFTAPTDPSVKGSVNDEAGFEPDEMKIDDEPMEQTMRSTPKDFPTLDFSNPEHPISAHEWPFREDSSSETEDDTSVGIESPVEEIEEDSSSYSSDGDASHRLLDPQKYFDSLETLERKIYGRSALKAHGDRRSQPLTPLTESMFSELTESSPIDGVRLYSQFRLACEIGDELQAVKIWYLLNCYHTMRDLWFNVTTLQDDHYCDTFINLLSMDVGDR